MSPLEHLLHTLVLDTDARAVSRLQQQPQGAQAVVQLVAEALHRHNAALQQLLDVLLSQNVQGCCPSLSNAESHKAQGNQAFKQQRFAEAIQHYSEALKHVHETSPPGTALAAALYCNRALCFLRLSPPSCDTAAQDASCAIACDAASDKAWFRRACARQGMGDMQGALQDAQQAVRLQQQRRMGPGAGGSASQALSLATALSERLTLGAEPPTASQAPTRQCSGWCRTAEPLGAAGHAEGTVAQARRGAGAQPTDPHHLPAGWSPSAAHAGASTAAEHGAQEHGAPATAANAAAPLAMQCSGGAVTVGWAATEGRFLAAARDLAAGEDVLREEPYALVLTRGGRRMCCHRCGQVLPATKAAAGPAPAAGAAPMWYCRGCPMAHYCSVECREQDEFHGAGGPECSRPWTALLPTEALLALRMSRKLLSSQGSPAANQQVASLEGHFAELAPAEAARLAALALLAHATWQRAQAALPSQQAPHRQSAPAQQRSQLSAEDVLRALCQIRVNGVAVVPPARTSERDRLGLAIFPVASCMNHACRPNVSLYFQGATAVVRTLDAIPVGAPLLHCYGPQQGEMSWQQRQAALRHQYCFACKCNACASGPTPADGVLVGLRCLHCGGSAAAGAGGSDIDGFHAFDVMATAQRSARTGRSATHAAGVVQPPDRVPPGIVSPFEVEPASAGTRSTCSTCGARLSAAEWQRAYLPRLQQAAQHAARAEDLVQAVEAAGPAGSAESAARAVQLLEQCLEERRRLLHPHNQLVGATHDALARALHAAGCPAAACRHLRASLGLLGLHYPPTSTATAFQKLKLAGMLHLLARAEAGAPAASAAGGGGALLEESGRLERDAAAALELHFGPGIAGTLLEGGAE